MPRDENEILGAPESLGTRLVRLKIVNANGLAKKDIFGASDPYVQIELVDIE